MYTLIMRVVDPDKSSSFKAQKRSEQVSSGVTQDESDFLQRMAQPPKGRPIKREESSILLTPTHKNSEEMLDNLLRLLLISQCSWMKHKSSESM